jgi:hypothetical protein
MYAAFRSREFWDDNSGAAAVGDFFAHGNISLCPLPWIQGLREKEKFADGKFISRAASL